MFLYATGLLLMFVYAAGLLFIVNVSCVRAGYYFYCSCSLKVIMLPFN